MGTGSFPHNDLGAVTVTVVSARGGGGQGLDGACRRVLVSPMEVEDDKATDIVVGGGAEMARGARKRTPWYWMKKIKLISKLLGE